MRWTDDTIAAIATAEGPAGLAVVRVSGRAAIEVADHVFRGRASLAASPSHTLHHGWAVRPASGSEENGRSRRLDEVVVALFRAPRSYTREDVIELSCHGGDRSARRILSALLAAGARLASPGEFTLRAFLHGRIDLTQAEAVSDLIHAATERAHDLALSQLAGDLGRRLDQLVERVADAAAEVEARVDFAEDVGGVEVPAHVVAAVSDVERELAELLADAAYGRALREGARVPLVGRPNVGKSSLFNALLGEDRAIVTPTPGTTRDRVSEAIELSGIRVTLSDTAGLRVALDPVEAIGIGLAERALDAGTVVMWVVDGSETLEPGDRRIAERLRGRRVVAALNKSDRGRRVQPEEIRDVLGSDVPVVPVSAARGAGLPALRAALSDRLGARAGEPDLPVTNPRHAEALTRARQALGRARAAANAAEPGEIVALELRDALQTFGEVTGRAVGEDLLDRIFSRFCVGK
ncbi:MAG: tRNA uridine-5-carboxymethylaminomethyl(34) synthesis GTPase MnmE [Candidatus Eisenbacteria bacterium]|uniref:tRNA modification GTPase MnmE n=1 Tax=Eiseniibacteriota bacterium TaxID=2212470 RepID=A0A538U324_UNCEI|nr:MAG: tRNA uridine-5-carboxymethylaminomethyl(34) synthesis GTPase MnmE [Candidatus Eisenbacteria bacterium]